MIHLISPRTEQLGAEKRLPAISVADAENPHRFELVLRCFSRGARADDHRFAVHGWRHVF